MIGRLNRYLGKLIDNKAVFRYLSQRQPEVLAQFEDIVQPTIPARS